MKKGAIELTTSTIVIIALAVLMLILGLVLVKNVMCGALGGIGEINEKIKQQMTDLFNSGERVVVKEITNEVQRGVNYGVAFAIRNEGKESSEFSYVVNAIDTGDCKMSKTEAQGLIVLGKKGDLNIKDGEDYMGLIKFAVPENSELCNLRYNVEVTNKGTSYGSAEFDVKIIGKKVGTNFC